MQRISHCFADLHGTWNLFRHVFEVLHDPFASIRQTCGPSHLRHISSYLSASANLILVVAIQSSANADGTVLQFFLRKACSAVVSSMFAICVDASALVQHTTEKYAPHRKAQHPISF